MLSPGKTNYRMLLFLFLLFSYVNSAGLTIQLSAHSETHAVSAGDIAGITVSAAPESDFYYAELDISYDDSVLEFVSVNTAHLTSNGLAIGGDLGGGRAGVSVSRTSPLPEPGSGPIMIITFRVRAGAVAGNTEVTFNRSLVLDSAAEPVDSEPPLPVMVEIRTEISDLRLLIPAVNTIDQGDSFIVNAAVFAAGVDDSNRMPVQIGINDIDSDPEGWPEGVWMDMDFDGADQQNVMQYSAEIAFMRPSGEWFVAVRSSLDGAGFVYGGPEGILTEPGAPLAVMNISPPPAFRYSLASWNFHVESLYPDISIPENLDSELRTAGASITGFLTGYSNLAVNSNNWSNKQEGPCYWWIDISTAGFISLEVSSRQYGSNTGPRDFRLEYSIDGFEWMPVEGGEITVGNNWTSGILERLPLPAVIENRENVRLRWIITSDISINGAITGPTGTNRLDGIIVTGVNPNPEQITVYPGDTNNDGIVNADDVLPLGMYWRHAGPPAAWNNTGFSPRNVEQWIPAGATFADTNGDGIVDHRDLLAVGMNFGKTAGTHNKDSGKQLAALVIDPSGGENKRNIIIEAGMEREVSGVAFRIGISDIPEDMWETGRILPGFTMEQQEEDIISFIQPVDGGFEAAFVLKGREEERLSQKMAAFELVIDERWEEPFTIYLHRLTVSSSHSSGCSLKEGDLVPAESITGIENIPDKNNLKFSINPNPFSDLLEICFHLDTPSRVRADITCMQGRMVAVLLNDFLGMGNHRIPFDGSFLPPGFYLCRLMQGNGEYGIARIVRIR